VRPGGNWPEIRKRSRLRGCAVDGENYRRNRRSHRANHGIFVWNKEKRRRPRQVSTAPSVANMAVRRSEQRARRCPEKSVFHDRSHPHGGSSLEQRQQQRTGPGEPVQAVK